MKKIIQICLTIFLVSLIISLLPTTGQKAQAQFLPILPVSGLNAPYFYLLATPMIRTPELINRYSGTNRLFNPPPPIMNTPQPITRRFHALTTITNIKLILPPSTATVVLNPYISPYIATAISIPVTTAQAQPILLAAGISSPVNPDTVFLYNILSPSLGTPSLTSILPSSVASILSIIP